MTMGCTRYSWDSDRNYNPDPDLSSMGWSCTFRGFYGSSEERTPIITVIQSSLVMGDLKGSKT